MREIRERADPASRIVVIDLKDGWLGGCDIAALGRVCDGAILCAYDMTAGAVDRLMQTGRAALGPGKHLGVGFRVFYPEVADPASLTDRVLTAAKAGADGINFYNYGLIPAARLDWVRQAVDALQTAPR